MIWQTRTISMFTAATAMTDGENPLIEQAQQIGRSPDEDDEDEQPATAEPRVGSYENFMNTFGNPRRWSGGM